MASVAADHVEPLVRRYPLLRILQRLWHEVGEDDVGSAAAALAYHFLLALFPFFIFLTALGAQVAAIVGAENPTEGLISQLRANLPQGIAALLTAELRSIVQTRSPGLLSFGIVGALWATMAGIKSLMRAMNRAYDVPESRPFLLQNAVALALALLFAVFVLGSSAVLLVGEVFASQIATILGLPGFVVTLVRWTLALVLILIATALVYRAAPNLELRFRWITAGSAVFTLGWLAATLAFAYYVDHFGRYNATYGALGGVVVLLVWFYITAWVLLLGAELNAIIDKRLAESNGDVSRR